MRVQGKQGVVLHSRPWSESSRLVDLFSREYGRIRVIAKGCRRLKSRTKAGLLPFRPLLLGWSGKGELPTLTGVEVPFKPRVIQGRSLVGAWYMNELLLRFLARLDAHPILYDQYVQSLDDLAEDRPVDLVLRNFECRLLRDIGYGLVFDHEADSNRPVKSDQRYLYFIDRGPVMASSGTQEFAQDAWMQPAIPVTGKTLQALSQGKLDQFGSREEARALMRAALAQLLEGKPLRSRLYLNQVQHFDKVVAPLGPLGKS